MYNHTLKYNGIQKTNNKRIQLELLDCTKCGTTLTSAWVVLGIRFKHYGLLKIILRKMI